MELVCAVCERIVKREDEIRSENWQRKNNTEWKDMELLIGIGNGLAVVTVSIFAMLFLADFLFKFCVPLLWAMLARNGVSWNWNYAVGRAESGVR